MFKFKGLRATATLPAANLTPAETPKDPGAYYDAIAERYHYFFRDWTAAMQRESGVLRRLYRDRDVRDVLDASCGVGTQAIALALNHYEVTAADPSPKMLLKAQENARHHGVADDITFVKADFLALPRTVIGPYDAVITKGNALPHLIADAEWLAALRGFYDLLRPGGLLTIGMRDFDLLLEDRPRFVPRHLHDADPSQDVIVFDVYDWQDTDPLTVTFNTFLVSGKGDDYAVTRFPVTYRAITRDEAVGLVMAAGFTDVQANTESWELILNAVRPA
jgi:SAM-dependent methyltransferase